MKIHPRSLKGQLILLSLLALIFSQAVPAFFIFRDRHVTLTAEWLQYVYLRAVSVADLLETTPADIHEKVLKSSSSGAIRFTITSHFDEVSEDERAEQELRKELQAIIPDKADSAKIVVYENSDFLPRVDIIMGRIWDDLKQTFSIHQSFPHKHRARQTYARIALPLKDNTFLIVNVLSRPSSHSALPLIIQLTTMILFVAIAFVIIIGRVVQPMKDLARAASALGRGETGVRLPEHGSQEVVETIRAFNDMQDRLSRFVGERTKMLAALSHDLRTPITSMRLRAEFIEEDETRGKILQTLDEMQQMAEATLSFAREEADHEETRLVDLGALIASVCADFSDVGADVVHEEVDGLRLRCRAVSLKRALRNLIENAIHYGHRARVSIENKDHDIIVVVDDDGPGIQEEDIEKVFKPFVRLEASRSRETGGVGLGLSIARSVIQNHGGDITLTNRAGGGLSVYISLPKSAPTAKA